MDSLIALLETYKYAILFPLAIVEGPILTVIAGFLVSLGIFDVFIVYGIVVAGDIIGDAFYYGLGRFGSGLLARHGRLVGATPERLARARELYQAHHFKTVVLSKVLYGIGTAGMIAAGSLKMPYRRFMSAAALVSLAQSTVLLALGVFFGYAYVQIAVYLNDFAAIVSVGALVALAAFAGAAYFKRPGA